MNRVLRALVAATASLVAVFTLLLLSSPVLAQAAGGAGGDGGSSTASGTSEGGAGGDSDVYSSPTATSGSSGSSSAGSSATNTGDTGDATSFAYNSPVAITSDSGSTGATGPATSGSTETDGTAAGATASSGGRAALTVAGSGVGGPSANEVASSPTRHAGAPPRAAATEDSTGAASVTEAGRRDATGSPVSFVQVVTGRAGGAGVVQLALLALAFALLAEAGVLVFRSTRAAGRPTCVS